MFALVRKWFGSRPNPIGVDFGADSLKLAQTRWDDAEPQLIAAASAEVPAESRGSVASRMTFFAQTVRQLLSEGRFIGRTAVLSLPASIVHILHLRMPRLDDPALLKALPWEIRGKIPIEPNHAILRHHVAGEVFLDSDPKNEIIVFAAARDYVNQLLAAADQARLEVIGVNVEPVVTLNCFGHIYRRKTDAAAVNCFIDIGCSSTRVVIAQNSHMLFARAIGIGSDHFNRAAASALKISVEDARLLRIRMCNPQAAGIEQPRQPAPPVRGPMSRRAEDVAAAPTAVSEDNDFALLRAGQAAARRRGDDPINAPASAAPAAPVTDSDRYAIAEQAAHQPLKQLIAELDRCRQYHEATFPSKPVERLIFVGGEANQRGLCQLIAQSLGLAAQLGDPMVRMARTTSVGIESGIDRRQPQPGWVIPIGLSLGSCSGAPEVPATRKESSEVRS